MEISRFKACKGVGYVANVCITALNKIRIIYSTTYNPIFTKKVSGKIMSCKSGPAVVAQWTPHPPQEQDDPSSNLARVYVRFLGKHSSAFV
jgi:hypothetical protein